MMWPGWQQMKWHSQKWTRSFFDQRISLVVVTISGEEG